MRADAARQRAEGRAVNRRLSRVEYVNTIRDLLAVDVPIKELLPADLPAPDGFENDGFSLRVSSVLIERYMEAAEAALKEVFVRGPKPATTKAKLSYKDERLYKLAKTEKTVAELDDAVVLLSEKTLGLSQVHAKMQGRYRFRVSAYSYQNKAQPMVLAVHWRSLDAGASGNHVLGHHAVPPDKAATIEFVVTLPKNSTIILSPDGLRRSPARKAQPGWPSNGWKSKGRSSTPGLRKVTRVYSARSSSRTRSWPMRSGRCATLIPSAFRRPASEELVRPYLGLVRSRLDQGYSCADALQVALKGVLCSPHFLFLENQPGRLDDFALATRLSYFLWSSMPDQELFDLAKKEKLHPPEVLRGQVERMLKDPKAGALHREFPRPVAGLAANRRHGARQEALSRVRRIAQDLDAAGNPALLRRDPHERPQSAQFRRLGFRDAERTAGAVSTASRASTGRISAK